MKSKLLFVLLFGFSLPIFYGFTKDSYSNNPTTEDDLLTAYGKYIYNRENCGRCHTLERGKDGKQALDGLDSLYSTAYIYIHILHGSQIRVGTIMPDFEYLSQSYFNKDTLKRFFNHCTEEEWAIADSMAIGLVNELSNASYEANPHEEAIALLKYLKSIPESEKARKIRLARWQKVINDSISLDSLWANSDSLILATINNKVNIQKGKIHFDSKCFICHGNDAKGRNGPNLRDAIWIHGKSDLEIAQTIAHGVLEKGMIAFKYTMSPEEVGQVIAYIKSLRVVKK